MSTPGGAIFFGPIRNPMVDVRTGIMTREWYLFFQGLFLRSGGSIAPSTNDQEQSPLPDLSSTVQQVDILENAFGQNPPPVDLSSSSTTTIISVESLAAQVGALNDLVAELTKQLQDLRQGTIL